MLANVKILKAMDKAAFIKTYSATKRNEIQVVGSITIVVFNEIFHKDTGMYEYVECSANTEDFDYNSVCTAYEEWKQERNDAQLLFAKQQKLAEIDAYDTSSAVNGFSLNGITVWLDKSTRVGLMNSTTITKAMGQPTTTLWLGESKMEVPCDTAIQLLSALEMYALECFNVTAAHKKAVSELTTIEEVEKYDITAGYPAQLKMEV